jgi:tetratricopeptide (TPR) repeat protein
MSFDLLHWTKIAICMTCLWSGLAMAQDVPEQALKLPAQEVKRLQAVLATPIDLNAGLATQKELFQQKDMAAWLLGDVVLRESILREWVKIDPPIAWRLRNVLSMTPKRAEAYEIGLALIKDGILRRPTDVVRLRAELALDYLQDGQVQQAQTMLDEAENTIKKEFNQVGGVSSVPYWRLRAEMEFHHARAIFLSRKGKLPESIESAKLAVAKGKESFSNDAPIGSTQKVHGRHWYIKTLAILASQQSAAGLLTDADVTLRQAYQFAKANGFSDDQLFGTYNAYADLRNAAGQFSEASAYAAKAERVVLNQGFVKGTLPWIGTQNRKNMALLGSEKWQEALDSFQHLDEEKARIGNRSTAGVRPDLRGFAYLKTGRADQALPLFRGNLRWHVNYFGEQHDDTAAVRGLYAAALWKTGDKVLSRQQFEQAVKVLTSPGGLSGDVTEDAYRLKVKKFIFQTYMEMLAETATQSTKDAALIFELADYLHASSVQQALTDAAVRSGVNVPGLADIIRKEQDAKNEMVSLIQYISGQGSEEDKRRNPQVVEQMRLRIVEIEESRKGYKAQIQKGFPEYFQLIQPKAPTHNDIAQALKSDEVFVSVLPMETQTFVWAIDASGDVKFHRWNQGQHQTQQLVDRIRKTLDVAGMGGVHRYSTMLMRTNFTKACSVRSRHL